MERTIYSEDHLQFGSAVRDYLQKQVLPHAEQYIDDKLIPRDVWRGLGEQGVLGLEIPESYGGGEADDYRFNAVAQEELAAVSMAFASSSAEWASRQGPTGKPLRVSQAFCRPRCWMTCSTDAPGRMGV